MYVVHFEPKNPMFIPPVGFLERSQFGKVFFYQAIARVWTNHTFLLKILVFFTG